MTLNIKWKRIGKGDYVAKFEGEILRIEHLDVAAWWWSVDGVTDCWEHGGTVRTLSAAKAAVEGWIKREVMV